MLVGRQVASVSRTPGHTKHLQTFELSAEVTLCDCPGLVFPVGGELLAERAIASRHVYECCGLFSIAQVREPYSSIRLLHGALDLRRLYNLRRDELEEELDEAGRLSPMGFCAALASKKGYRVNRGRGAPDTHRAGLEVLRDCVDGVLCLAFDPPAPS